MIRSTLRYEEKERKKNQTKHIKPVGKGFIPFLKSEASYKYEEGDKPLPYKDQT